MFGGITAAIIALPVALAFGLSSGMGPMAGLYSAVCVGLLRHYLVGLQHKYQAQQGR